MITRSAVLALVFGTLFGALSSASARADGEAGLVVQVGETVQSFCVAFTGDGISGDQLLKAAGQSFEAYGSGSGLAVCSIQGQGCSDSGSFSSCFCKCQGSSCTYWALFTRGYGKNWIYSSLAFNLLRARDGDVHGWKWGAGGPNSAPAPQDITFDQICGHAPRGGAAVAPTATATTTPPQAAASPTAPAQSTPSPTATVASEVTLAPPPSAAAATALVTIAGSSTASPSPAASAPVESSSRGPGRGTIVAFGSVVGLLLAAIGGTAVWRSRHG